MTTATNVSPMNRLDVRVSRDTLLAAIELCAKAAPPKSTIKILSCLKLEASGGGRLAVAATDLDVTLIRTIEGADISHPGSTCVNAAAIRDAVRACSGDEVDLSIGDNLQVTVHSGSATFRILAMPGEDFPRLPERDGKEEFEIETWKLQAALRATSFATDNTETRFSLGGVLLRTKKKLIEIAATDGHRMALVNFPMAKAPDVEFMVPLPAITLVQRFESESVTVSLGEHLGFVSGETTLFARTKNVHFPNVRDVVQDRCKYSVKVDRERLLAIVTSVVRFAPVGYRALRFELRDGRLFVGSINPEFGSGVDSCPVEFSGPPGTVFGLSGYYVRDALEAISGGHVLIDFTDRDSQVHFRPADPPGESDPKEVLHVVMPMRVQ